MTEADYFEQFRGDYAWEWFGSFWAAYRENPQLGHRQYFFPIDPDQRSPEQKAIDEAAWVEKLSIKECFCSESYRPRCTVCGGTGYIVD